MEQGTGFGASKIADRNFLGRPFVPLPGLIGPFPRYSLGAGLSSNPLRLLSMKNNLERGTGFEPAASTLARLHSTAELPPQNRKNAK